MKTRHAGIVEELIAMQECVKRNWIVSVPYGNKASYDFIYDAKGQLCRVQVKTIYQSNSMPWKPWQVSFTKGNSALSKCPEDRKYTREDCDVIAAVCATHGKVFVFPVELVGHKRQATFSFDRKGNQDSFWVFDYENAWPYSNLV